LATLCKNAYGAFLELRIKNEECRMKDEIPSEFRENLFVIKNPFGIFNN
jgi:hypothetical protein